MDLREYYKDIAHKNLEVAKEGGWVIEKINPLGHVYHWYRKGRKVCFETRIKLDKDGFDRWDMNKSYLRIYKKIKR